MVVPQLRLLSAGYALVTRRYPFSGGGVAAAKISDSMTEQLLGGGVDRRAGGGAIQTAAQWQWGDAENAIKAWSSLLAAPYGACLIRNYQRKMVDRGRIELPTPGFQSRDRAPCRSTSWKAILSRY